MEKYLRPTAAIDCDNESVKRQANQLTEGQGSATDKAKSLFRFVRDEVRYRFYALSDFLDDYRASATMARGEGFCIQKAIVLAALARAVGIPARLRFAVIRNPLARIRSRDYWGETCLSPMAIMSYILVGSGLRCLQHMTGSFARERDLFW